jgi:hypothetical protein
MLRMAENKGEVWFSGAHGAAMPAQDYMKKKEICSLFEQYGSYLEEDIKITKAHALVFCLRDNAR